MKRFCIPNDGPDLTTIPKAIALGIRECQAIGSNQLTIITPKNNLRNIVVGDYLGDPLAARLAKGEIVPVGNYGVNMNHESVATIQKNKTPKVGIAFYVSNQDMQKLDGLRFECLILVPWIPEEGLNWAAKWDAETLGEKTRGAEVELPTEVLDRIENLTNSVNLSTGLSHSSDKSRAKRTFSELQSEGITWKPYELEKWAVRNGWKPHDAVELSELSAKYT